MSFLNSSVVITSDMLVAVGAGILCLFMIATFIRRSIRYEWGTRQAMIDARVSRADREKVIDSLISIASNDDDRNVRMAAVEAIKEVRVRS